jgi:hypothetical protein
MRSPFAGHAIGPCGLPVVVTTVPAEAKRVGIRSRRTLSGVLSGIILARGLAGKRLCECNYLALCLRAAYRVELLACLMPRSAFRMSG